jgi:hypothetical protein
MVRELVIDVDFALQRLRDVALVVLVEAALEAGLNVLLPMS